MKAKVIGAVVAVLLAMVSAASAFEEFTLRGDESLTVSTSRGPGWLYNQSKVWVVSGGSVSYRLDAYDTSTVNVCGGAVNNVYANNSSSVNLSGGAAYGFLFALETSTVDMSGGSAGGIEGRNSSTVKISGGIVVNNVTVYDASTVDISGGSLDRCLEAYGTNTVDISGGTVSNLGAYNASTVNISGGSSYRISANNTSTVNVCGGAVGELRVWDTTTVTFDGQDFLLGAGLSLNGDKVLGTGTLSGKWMDGTPWTVTISRNDAGATILAIPEPATLALLALGGLAVIRRRRSR